MKQGRFPVIRKQLPACGKTDVCRRVNETEEGDGPQDVFGRKGRAAFHPCSGNGHKGIDGDGLDAELLKGKGHIDAVLPSFSHADDAAGANTEARALGGLDGADAVIEGMARADMREKAAAGFNVMMVACDAGSKKAAQLVFA